MERICPSGYRPRGGNAGFTLVELVIALSLVGIVVVVLFSGLRLGGRISERLDEQGERIASMSSAQAFLRRTLGQAQVVLRTVDTRSITLFAGDSRRLDFVAPLSRHAGLTGLYLLRLEVSGEDEGMRLILTRWLLHPEILAGDGTIPRWLPLDSESLDLAPPGGGLDRGEAESAVFGRTHLMEGIETLEFGYYGQRREEEEPAWHPDWIEQDTLPRLVRVQLGQPGRWWPDLVVALPGI